MIFEHFPIFRKKDFHLELDSHPLPPTVTEKARKEITFYRGLFRHGFLSPGHPPTSPRARPNQTRDIATQEVGFIENDDDDDGGDGAWLRKNSAPLFGSARNHYFYDGVLS